MEKNMGKSWAKPQQIDDQLPVDCFGLPRHAGFAMLETGCCRAKNASNVLMKNLVNVCAGTLVGGALVGLSPMALPQPTVSSDGMDSLASTCTPTIAALETLHQLIASMTMQAAAKAKC